MKTIIDHLKKLEKTYQDAVTEQTAKLDSYTATVKSKLSIAEENENIVKILREKLAGEIVLTDQYGPIWQFEQAAKTARLLSSAAAGDAARASKSLSESQELLDEVRRAITLLQEPKKDN